MDNARTGLRGVFACCVRDCEPALPKVLKNIERLSSLYAEAAFIFVENDSKDKTQEILRAWCAKRPNASLINLDGLARHHPVRTMRIAEARKRYLSEIKKNFADYSHLVVLDGDDANSHDIDLAAAGHALQFLDSDESRAGVFANQQGYYYDLWALRHAQKCPADVWEEVLDRVDNLKIPDQEAFHKTFVKRIFSLPANAEPLEVDSAFGGLGIYKIRAVVQNPQTFVGYKTKMIATARGRRDMGWQVCEHVSFNQGLRDIGRKLFVFPSLINKDTTAIPVGPAFAYRSMAFDLDTYAIPNLPSHQARRNGPCPCGSGRKYKHCHGKDD